MVQMLRVSVLILIVALFGPSLVHVAYRLGTSDRMKLDNSLLYQDLANAELKLQGKAKEHSQERRLKLARWFHSRGWPIDEDDEDKPAFHDWKELGQYWFQH